MGGFERDFGRFFGDFFRDLARPRMQQAAGAGSGGVLAAAVANGIVEPDQRITHAFQHTMRPPPCESSKAEESGQG
jgi:hypothetical protein